MRRTSLLAVVYVVLIFVSGLLTGIFGYRLYLGGSVRASAPRAPDEYRRHYIAEMEDRLKLTPEQVGGLRVALDTTRDEYRAFRDKYKPELQAIQDAQIRRINAILTNEQRAEYDKMRDERAKLRKKSH